MYQVSERLSSSRLHKCTCFGKSVNWTCSELVRSMHGLHDQKSLHETCLSGFVREKSILHLSSTLEIYSTKTTSFPVAALDSIYRCASTISSNLNTRSRRTV